MDENPYKSPREFGRPDYRRRRRWFTLAAVVLAGLLGLSVLRLGQAMRNGSELTIVRGQIACGVLAILFAGTLSMLWRSR
ncbi:MAG TPA: hypothetical protein VGX76_05835 [Pirellulales bacterium]|jgi:hypothetical protein|nr:hypothetical protein [Pirellulales bacterium]